MGIRDMADPCEEFKQALIGRIEPKREHIAVASMICVYLHPPSFGLSKDVKDFIEHFKNTYPSEFIEFCNYFQEAEKEDNRENVVKRINIWMKNLYSRL